MGTNLTLLGNLESTHSLQKPASGIQLKQEAVVLTQKIRMKNNPVHRIVDLVILDNLEITNSIHNKASGDHLYQEVVMIL